MDQGNQENKSLQGLLNKNTPAIERPQQVAKPLVNQANAGQPRPTQYKANRLKRLIKANGQVIKPNAEGIFINPDHETRLLLEEFFAMNRDLVTKV